MDLTYFTTLFPPITKDLIVYLPVLQLQGGFWMAIKQTDVSLTNACQLWLINMPEPS
jgi:hypothetical protein